MKSKDNLVLVQNHFEIRTQHFFFFFGVVSTVVKLTKRNGEESNPNSSGTQCFHNTGVPQTF